MSSPNLNDGVLARCERKWKLRKKTGKVVVTLNDGGVIGIQDMAFVTNNEYKEVKTGTG